MELRIQKLHSEARMPEYAHSADAGMDLFAVEETRVPAHGNAKVAIGIVMAIPDGYVGLVWDKSGLSTRYGLAKIAGVIDAGYRGEISIVMTNATDTDYVFAAGDKVAQMLIQAVEHPTLVEVDTLDATDRGEGGFGSTGK